MTKVYVLFYDEENGQSRETWNTFHTPLEVYTDLDICNQRMDFIEQTYPGVVCHIVKSDIGTVFDTPLADHWDFNDDDADNEDDNSDDDTSTTAPTVTAHMPPAEAEEDAFKYGDSSWLSVDPEEYFFYATLGKDPTGVRATLAYIVPVRYWDINHTVCDQQGRIDLPDGFELVGVNQYVFNGSPSAARMSLRDLGLVDNMAFADAVAKSTE